MAKEAESTPNGGIEIQNNVAVFVVLPLVFALALIILLTM